VVVGVNAFCRGECSEVVVGTAVVAALETADEGSALAGVVVVVAVSRL